MLIYSEQEDGNTMAEVPREVAKYAHSFLFSKYLLNMCHVPGIMLEAGDLIKNKPIIQHIHLHTKYVPSTFCGHGFCFIHFTTM